MHSLHKGTAFCFAAAVCFAMSASPLSKSQTAASVADTFASSVYAWFPDNTATRLSPGLGLFVQAHIHPQGTAAVFWGGVEGRPRVWLYDFALRTARPLTPPDVGSVEPSFDWQGRRIVFASDTASPTHLELLTIARSWKARTYGYSSDLSLFVTDADGTNVRQITRGPFKDSRPVFSPDGKEIAFLSNRGGGGNGLYIAPVDGSTQPRRVLQETGIGRPWFSSDGQFIYFFFSNAPDDHQRICRVPVGGGSWEPVTPDGLPRSHGSFADPDGIHVWFHSTKGDETVPYRFNLQTRDLVRMIPPRFITAGHVTRSHNNIITFDSTEPDLWR